jgi:hypothetical protein
MNNASKYIGVKCPICGNDAYTKVNMFTINGGKVSSYCDNCTEKVLEISKTDSGYEINLTCFICSDKHIYRLSAKEFLSREVFAFSCPASGFDSIYIGSKDDVFDCMDELNDRLEVILKETTADSSFNVPSDFKETLTNYKKQNPDKNVWVFYNGSTNSSYMECGIKYISTAGFASSDFTEKNKSAAKFVTVKAPAGGYNPSISTAHCLQ